MLNGLYVEVRESPKWPVRLIGYSLCVLTASVAETSEQGGRGMKLALRIIGGVLTIGAVAVGTSCVMLTSLMA